MILDFKWKKLIVLLIVCISFQSAFCSKAEASWASAEEYVKNVGFNSSSYVSNWSYCADPTYYLLPIFFSAFYSVYLPTVLPIPSDATSVGNMILQFLEDEPVAFAMVQMATATFLLSQHIIQASILSLGLVDLIYLWVFLSLADTCTNTFIMMPHEYVNRTKGFISVSGNYNIHPCAASRDDVPYYFQCNNTTAYGYNSEACAGYNPNTVSDSCNCSAVTSGGVSACQCGSNKVLGTPPAYCFASPGDVGHIKVGYDGTIFNHRGSAYRPHRTMSFNTNSITTRMDITDMANVLYSYYSQDPTSGSMQVCVAAPSNIPPVIVGCGSISPPISPQPIFDSYYNNSRCAYLVASRSDLASLADSLSSTDYTNHNASSVLKFLRGNLHMASNLVGCIQDLMLTVTALPYAGSTQGFFAKMQNSMKSLVFMLLVLYVALVGIKIMTSAAELDLPQYVMFLLKFALVTYFVTPIAWYQIVGGAVVGNITGVLPVLLSLGTTLGSFMTDALNVSDPVGLCRYQLADGSQLLSDQLYVSGGIGNYTAGYNGVKLSMWDFIDCKLANYLNFGSCNYTFKGLIVFWMISLCFSFASMFSMTIIVFAIVMIIYCYVMLKIVVKMVNLFVLSMVVLTVLVMLSPLFIAFSLFEFTKGMFETWAHKLLGYAIYPALLTGAMCLILAVIDSVYNGSYNSTASISSYAGIDEAAKISSYCQSNSGSLFCKTVNYAGSPCSASSGKMSDTLARYSRYVFGPLTFTSRLIDPIVIAEYYKILPHLVIIVLLMLNCFKSIIGIVEAIAGVSLNDAEESSFIQKAVKQAASMAVQAATKGAGNAVMQGLKSKYGDKAAGGGGGDSKGDGGDSKVPRT